MTKKHKILIGLGFIGLILWMVWPRVYYIAAPEGKIYIPGEIVRSKDCTAYSKFVERLTRPGFVPDPSCPWAKISKIGKFTMGDVTLHVPREYIWYNRNKPDGAIDGLNLVFRYPDMTPGSVHDVDKSNNINVTLRYPHDTKICHEGSCWDPLVWQYRTRALHESNFTEMNPADARYDSQFNLKTFRKVHKTIDGSVGGVEDIFFRGDYRTPDYWIICKASYEGKDGFVHTPNPSCQTAFYIKKPLMGSLRFNRRNLQNHQDIYQKTLTKLRSFVQPK